MWIIISRYIGMIYSGFVLSWVWQWFAVPMGASQLSLLQAVGICLVPMLLGKEISYSDLYLSEKKMKADKQGHQYLLWSKVVANSLLGPTLVLFFGYVTNVLMAYFG